MKMIYVLVYIFACMISFYASADHSCEIKNGKVVCVGDNGERQCDVPKLKNPRQVALGDLHTCALDDGGVKCWGYNYFGQTNVPSLKNPRQLVAGDWSTCALDDDGVSCWGGNGRYVPPLRKVLKILFREHVPCAVDESSFGVTREVCWGRDSDYIRIISPRVDQFTNIEEGRSLDILYGAHYECGFYNEALECWGFNEYGQANVPLLKNPRQVVAGHRHTCALDDDGVKCWGISNYGQTYVPPLKNPRRMVAGGDHTCAMDDDGVKCWGNKEYGQTYVPSVRKVLEISIPKYDLSCAVDESLVGVKRKICWGKETKIEILFPNLDQFTNIVKGKDYECGLYMGLLECWGNNECGQANVSSLVNPKRVVFGENYTCALDDGGVKCWGKGTGNTDLSINNLYGNHVAVANQDNFYQIAKDQETLSNNLSSVLPIFLSYVFKNELRFFYSFDKSFGEKLFKIIPPGSKYSKLMALFHSELKNEMGLIDSEEKYRFLWNKEIYLPYSHEFLKETSAPENDEERKQLLNVLVESIKTTISLMTDEYKQRASALILKLSTSVDAESLSEAAEFVTDAGINPYIRPRVKLQMEFIRLLGL